MKFQIPNSKSQINSKFQILTFLIVILLFTFSIFNFVKAAINIDSTYRYAWNDVVGWIDFYSDNVNVLPAQLNGYADSSVGYIALDCATSPSPPTDCATFPDWKVSNDGNGYLWGWAWNDAIGWISFDSATAGSPYVYEVTVNALTGDFSGWAWNDIVGWISFNCNNSGIGNTCAPPEGSGNSTYKVKTVWRAQSTSGSLISSVFDTGVTSGVAINTIMWQGNQPSDTNVTFQIASSNSSAGPWFYFGPDGSETTYYDSGALNIPIQINSSYHNNHRYFRYKVILESNAAQTLSPRVDDVIINWSP